MYFQIKTHLKSQPLSHARIHLQEIWMKAQPLLLLFLF